MLGTDCFAITGTLSRVDSNGAGLIIAGFDSVVNGMAIGQTKTVTIPAAQANGT
jgi:FKBP-type peptidyl-prolyl cis-trans isomerase 2